MAANMKEIKERIDSVKNTSQITNAMNIVSSTKFKRFQVLTLKSRNYARAVNEAFDNLVASLTGNKFVIFDGKPEVKKVGIIVVFFWEGREVWEGFLDVYFLVIVR